MKDLTTLAKEITNLNFFSIQSDSPDECQKAQFLINELDELPKKDVIRLLFHIIEVINLNSNPNIDPLNPFKDMLEYKYIDGIVNCYQNERNNI